MKVRNEAPVFTLIFWGWVLFGIVMGLLRPFGLLTEDAPGTEVFIAVWVVGYFALFSYGLVREANRKLLARRDEENDPPY